MVKNTVSIFSGVLFGAGLVVSGMIDPNVVEGFLDVFGNWNIALAGVMLAAIPTFSFFYFIISKRLRRPFCSDAFPSFSHSQIDRRLISGAVLFGAGWGLGGICPGPGVVVLVTMAPYALLFMFFLVVGMILAKRMLKT